MKLVLLAGGSGTRLWPISRSHFPKQFINLTSSSTMLQETILRLPDEIKLEPYVICNDSNRFLVSEQLNSINVCSPNIILEPFGKNTAPAIGLAAFDALKNGHDPILLVLPSDHVISDQTAFHKSLEYAEKLADQGKLVTFGINPSHAETGYGYIKKGDKLSYAYKVANFVEKPSLKLAEEYYLSGNYFWNSGMFAFRASVFLEKLKYFCPEIYSICENSISNSYHDLCFIRIRPDIFEECPEVSIDYAVMEKTSDSVMVELNAGWSDVGTWSSLYDNLDKDSSQNVISGDVLTQNTSNSFIQSSDRLITTVGVDNLVIIDTKDALLVVNKDKSQEVKSIVDLLKDSSRSEYNSHREVYRPWGHYDTITRGNRYQVKRITVNPGSKLSVQMHYHRAEHWIIVSGSALVTIGDKELFLTENQSTYIPIGEIHSLENPGKIPLELIEVQSGPYLGEDDIIRLQDKYGRD